MVGEVQNTTSSESCTFYSLYYLIISEMRDICNSKNVQVFHRVAQKYDIMNDLMSGGS